MEKTINEIYIKICDKYPVKEKFDFDEEFDIHLKGEIVKKEIKNNQDGTVSLVLNFKAINYEIKKLDK